MRGGARIRRLLRRGHSRFARPEPVPPPAIVLGDALPDSDARGLESLRTALRFPHSRAELAAIAADPDADRGLGDLAEAALAGAPPFFDRRDDQPLPPDWLAVPGGGRWRLAPRAGYDHGDFVRWGDVRLLWERGRLQVLPLLTAAARVGGRPVLARAAFAHLAAFREANPVGWGPHWIAGLEAGLRVFSILWAWGLAEDPDDEALALMAAALVENGRFVESHLSLKEIANNHLVGEAAALYCLGCALPGFAEAARWRDRGRGILDRELAAQVGPDGVQGEQAVEYHRFVLEFALQALLWGRAAGETIPAGWEPALRSMFRPLAALTGPDGRLVSLGDDDGGRVLRLDDRHRRDARGLLAIGSRLLGVDGLGPLAGKPDGEALWLLGPEAARREPPPGGLPAVERFDDAGWLASRFGEARSAIEPPPGHLVFKAGPMGRGGAGHSHADQLSLCLSLGGRPVLVDPGTFLYNGEQVWRDHFRGAAAHSLLRVGGRDFATPLPAPDRFGWAERSSASFDRVHAGERLRLFSATREGDRDPAGRPLSVARRVLQVMPGLVVVIDELPGRAAAASPSTSPLLLELIWACAPGIEARWQPAAAPEVGGPSGAGGDCAVPGLRFHALGLERRDRGELLVHLYAPEGMQPFLREGELSPPAGWFSEDYGRKEPAVATGLAGGALEPLVLVSVLADPGSHPRLVRSALSLGPDGDWRLEIGRELDETVRVSFRRLGEGAGPVRDWVEDLELEAGLAMAVLDPDGRPLALLADTPRRCEHAGRDLLAEAAPAGDVFDRTW